MFRKIPVIPVVPVTSTLSSGLLTISPEIPQISQNVPIMNPVINSVAPVNAQINFFNPLTGQVVHRVNNRMIRMSPFNVRTTQLYNRNGYNVVLSGMTDNIRCVITTLDTHPSNVTVTQPCNQGNIAIMPPMWTNMQIAPFNMRSTELYNRNGYNVVISGIIDNIRNVIAVLDANPCNITTNQPCNQTNQTVVLAQNPPAWHYIQNPANAAKNLLQNSLGNKYSGSGVVLIEVNPTGNHNIILMKTIRGTFEDAGGELDTSIIASADTLKHNASKELAEETQELFVINNFNIERHVNGIESFININDSQNGAMYRCYFIPVTGIAMYQLESIFSANKKAVTKTVHTNETVELARFNMNTLKNAVQATPIGAITCANTLGFVCTIRDRTAQCLREFFANQRIMTNTLSMPITPQYSTSGVGPKIITKLLL